jgi:hypothetical protein
MAWLIITDDCQIRLVDGKPRFYSRDRLSLREVIDRVQAWARSHEDCRVDAWIEAAEEELDLDTRIERFLELDSLLGFSTTRQEARVMAVRARQFEKGEQALEQGDYSGALGLFSHLAESGHPNAQFELGLMSAKGLGIPKDYLRAYVWFGAAAQRGHERAEDAKSLIVSRLTNDELAEAERRIAELRVKDEPSV